MAPDSAWQPPLQVQASAWPVLRAEAFVAPALAWFDGHFPGRPILPGVALLALVRRAVAAAPELCPPGWWLTGLRQVRFRRMVEPGDTVRVQVEALDPAGDDGRFRFEVSVADELCAQGLLVFAPALDPAAAGS